MPSLISGLAGSSQRLAGGLAAGGALAVSDVPAMALQVCRQAIGPTVGYFRRTNDAGLTKDSAGAALGACTVKAFAAATDLKVDQQVSDAAGVYAIAVYTDGSFYLVARKAGSPNVAGVSDTLTLGAGLV